MKKQKIEEVVKLIPDVLSKMGEYFKDCGNQSLKAVSENTGTIGLVVKIFGQPMINKYFSGIENDKLVNFGINTYLKASLIQAGISLNKAIENIDSEYSIDGLLLGINKTLLIHDERIKRKDWAIFFQPKYHPVVVEVEKLVEDYLLTINVSRPEIEAFKKNYFEEIELRINETFGKELHGKHLSQVKQFWLKENESQLLNDNLLLSKIGFKDNENLMYEEAFGELLPVSSLLKENDLELGVQNLENIIKREQKLKRIEDLIKRYFDNEKNNHLKKILFLVADFGKGKSVFLKHYTSKLTREYLNDVSNYFPIYFNLRNFKDYSDEHFLGVVGDYLEVKYGIEISDEYFRNKKFIFLIDSLDESGELNSHNIDKVIASIKKIQNIDPVLYTTNKIIITTRPFAEGLKRHLEIHQPLVLPNSQGRPVEYFVSLYGFKKEQFNSWLYNSLKDKAEFIQSEPNSLNDRFLQSIIKQEAFDVYELLLREGIISSSELRRPIFSYMIFQLIINGINFDKAGKIGIYLSFLNLLTREAKYLHDIAYKINLVEQFEGRNILHSTAALWLYNKNSNNKSEMKKADLCRTLEGEIINESDNLVVNKFKETSGADIEFLSHSYFGENNSMLHFQHQSFAEILLAEYYIKVLIKFSLDEEFDYEQARIKLTLGLPTNQAIDFFKELLSLLRDSVTSSENMFEQRKLLFPLLASLATRKNNKTLHSSYLFYRWYDKISFEDNVSEFPAAALNDWPITSESLKKICDLCRSIVDSDKTLSLQTGEFKTSLYNNEVLRSSISSINLNIDKFIVLVAGNILYNNYNEQIWFNSSIKNVRNLFNLFTESMRDSLPGWVRSYFCGIKMESNSEIIDLSNLHLYGVNFSHSKLHGILFNHSNLNASNFSNCEIEFCDFGFCQLTDVSFENTRIPQYSRFALSTLLQGVYFPYNLAKEDFDNERMEGRLNLDKVFDIHFAGIYSNYGDDYSIISTKDKKVIEKLANNVGHLLKDGVKRKLWKKETIFHSFQISEMELKDLFVERLKQIFDS